MPEYLPLTRMIEGADVVLDSRGADYYRAVTDRLYDVALHPRYQDERPTGLSHIHIVDDFARFLGVTLEDRQPRLTVPSDLTDRLRPQVEALRRRGPDHRHPARPLRAGAHRGRTRIGRN